MASGMLILKSFYSWQLVVLLLFGVVKPGYVPVWVVIDA